MGKATSELGDYLRLVVGWHRASGWTLVARIFIDVVVVAAFAAMIALELFANWPLQ